MNFSFGYLVGPSSSSCGYCGSDKDTSQSFGIWAYSLTVEQYQKMLDYGWCNVLMQEKIRKISI
jgi:arginine-tRNA-protein transferase